MVEDPLSRVGHTHTRLRGGRPHKCLTSGDRFRSREGSDNRRSDKGRKGEIRKALQNNKKEMPENTDVRASPQHRCHKRRGLAIGQVSLIELETWNTFDLESCTDGHEKVKSPQLWEPTQPVEANHGLTLTLLLPAKGNHTKLRPGKVAKKIFENLQTSSNEILPRCGVGVGTMMRLGLRALGRNSGQAARCAGLEDHHIAQL